MVQTAIVHARKDLTLEQLMAEIAGSVKAELTIAPFQLPRLGKGRVHESPHGPIVSSIHVAIPDPICLRLPDADELRELRRSWDFLENVSPADWRLIVRSPGCVCVESARTVTIQNRMPEMTVYAIPVLRLSDPEIQQAIWRVADALDGLVLGEVGQLIRRPGESSWTEW